MRKYISLLPTVLITLFIGQTFAQTTVSDLQDEIQAGRIAVENMQGKGSSTGMAIEGRIRNTTSKTLRINTNLKQPVYLGNRTSRLRQNMVAFSVYERGGSYFTDGRSSFIEVPANESYDVQLLAYCADYEKENPTSADQFVISQLPSGISDITRKIAEYKRKNPDDNSIQAFQVALWLAQGLTPEEIRKTFDFSQQDEIKARRIMNQ
jgi:hypothetical protein